jgi:hypothetical protein
METRCRHTMACCVYDVNIKSRVFQESDYQVDMFLVPESLMYEARLKDSVIRHRAKSGRGCVGRYSEIVAANPAF